MTSLNYAIAQKEQDIIKYIENADSKERIKRICDLYDDKVTNGEAPGNYDATIAACYREVILSQKSIFLKPSFCI